MVDIPRTRFYLSGLSASGNSHKGTHEGVNSRFMHGLKLSGVEMNRKMLSEMAIHEPDAFTALIEKSKLAIGA